MGVDDWPLERIDDLTPTIFKKASAVHKGAIEQFVKSPLLDLGTHSARQILEGLARIGSRHVVLSEKRDINGCERRAEEISLKISIRRLTFSQR